MGGDSSCLVITPRIHAFDCVDVPRHEILRYTMTAERLFERAELIDGVRFQSLEDLYVMKAGMSRSKDIDDAELIRRELKRFDLDWA